MLHRTGDHDVNVAEGRYLAARIPGAKFVELAGDDHWISAGDVDALADEIEEFVTGTRPAPEPDRVLATVLFTDIVGSTQRAVELGDRRWRELLGAHDAAVRRELERFRGREVDTAGDGFLATFDGPARAVRCALSIGGALRELGVDVRAGIHTGECELDGDKVRGIAVHTGARVAALAGPGEVLISQTVKDLTAGSGLEFADRGVHELKGDPRRVAALRRRLNLRDEHAVVRRRRVGEDVGARFVSHRALQHEELPERIGLALLDESGEREKVEAVGREDLLQQRVVLGRGRVEAVRPLGVVGVAVVGARDERDASGQRGDRLAEPKVLRERPVTRRRDDHDLRRVHELERDLGTPVERELRRRRVVAAVRDPEDREIRLEQRRRRRGVGLVLPHFRARHDREVAFDVDGVRGHDDGDVGLRGGGAPAELLHRRP